MFITKNRGWLLIAEIHFRDQTFDQYLHLKNTRDNKRAAERTKQALEAARLAGKFEEEFAHRFPNSPHLARLGINLSATELTLGDYAIEQWLSEKPKLTDATRYDYESQLRFHLMPHPLAAMRLSAVNDGDVNRFIRDLQTKQTRSKKSLSERRINMVISRLRNIFATAHRRKLIVENPMLHVENLREAKSEVDPFDLAEALRIIEAAKGWERSFLVVLLFTGMRPGEALALCWDVIDWDHDLIHVRQTVNRRYGFGLPKTPGSERQVEMIAQVRSALSEQRARSQMRGSLVFPSEKGTSIDLANFRARNWPRILQRAKVRPRRLYQCRHTFARLAIEHGDTPQHVAAQLGHTSVEMVFRVYTRWMARPESAALAALERAISIPSLSPKSRGEMAGKRGK